MQCLFGLGRNNKVAIYPGRVELFCLFVACSYMQLHSYHVVLVGYGPACPKFFENKLAILFSTFKSEKGT